MTDKPKSHPARTGAITHIKASNKYRARIMVNGIYKHVGMYATHEEAQKALRDILFDIEQGQYIDPAQARKAQKQAKELAQKQERERLNEQKYQQWKAKQTKTDWD